jgi:carbohydrate diacid regulator
MVITTALAQQIIDMIAPIVQQNINIMDNTGKLIGSGQKSRINTYHQGAKDAVEHGNFVEIYPQDLEQYPGSLPGLNWPIILGNQIVGVVGVSGHPDLVRDTAKLVKMVTELILERELLIEEFKSHSHLLEQFFQLLLSENAVENDPQIIKLATLLRFDLDLPRIAAVINIRPLLEDAFNQYGSNDLVFSRKKESLTAYIKASPIINEKDIFIFRENELIFLRYYPADTIPEVFEQWGSAFMQLLNKYEPEIPLHLGIGSLTTIPLQLYSSYKEALFSLENSLQNAKVTSIFNFDVLASYLVKEPGAINSCLAFKMLQQKLTKKMDQKYDMLNTIKILLENNLNVSTTAKNLFIHRNTLVFRLEKLKQLTGLCPNQFLNHAILCKLLSNF